MAGVQALPMDHPRGCGEHRLKNLQHVCDPGSSPRMRGTLPPAEPAADCRRIIAADAGNTFQTLCLMQREEDHPRGCGEHVRIGYFDAWDSGSSPRMRGTQFITNTFILFIGIIPADAGNTNAPMPSSNAGPDHPRGCGEHGAQGTAAGDELGSSPRMRGTLAESTRGYPGGRIIPADAGNTASCQA